MSVVGNVRRAISLRFKLLVVGCLMLVLGLVCGGLCAFERGPIFCNNGCEIAVPAIDPMTRVFLQSHLAPVEHAPFWMYLTGTTYMVCNSTHCATYRQSFDGLFVADERVERTPPSNAGGIGSGNGNPGVGGQGGGHGGGGGGGGGGTGSVTVGDPDMVRPPNHEN